MLLLHIAVILPFATCQLLVLPSPASSEIDAPIDKMECMEGCTMPFLSQASTSGTPYTAQFCDDFVQMKECVWGCPGGAERMKLVAGMVPQYYKLVTEMCEREGTARTLSPDVLSGVLNDAAGMEQLDDCVTGCELNLHAPMIGDMIALLGLTNVCQAWGNYKGCVTRCPDGAEVLTSVQKMIPSIFKTIEDTCGPVSSTGPSSLPVFPFLLNADGTTNTDITELATDNTKYSEATEPTDTTGATQGAKYVRIMQNAEGTTNTVIIELNTDNTEYSKAVDPTDSIQATDTTGATQATDTTGATQATDSTGVDIAKGRIACHTDSSYANTEATSDVTVSIDALESMFNCKGKCLLDLGRLRVSNGVQNMCDAWENLTKCYFKCDDDLTNLGSMFRGLLNFMPNTVDYLVRKCNISNQPIKMDYQTMQQLLAEEKATNETVLCIQDCEVHL